MKELHNCIRKIILEIYKEENELYYKKALFAFINQDNITVTKIEDTHEENFENAFEKNDYKSSGYSYLDESPVISFKYNNSEYDLSVDITKQYYYESEKEGQFSDSIQNINLQSIDIANNKVTIFENGNEQKFELDGENIKKLEKVLQKYIS